MFVASWQCPTNILLYIPKVQFPLTRVAFTDYPWEGDEQRLANVRTSRYSAISRHGGIHAWRIFFNVGAHEPQCIRTDSARTSGVTIFFFTEVT